MPEARGKEVALVVQRPTIVGVYADEVLMLKIDNRVSLSFVQLYDLKESEARGQVAALVYMSTEKARQFCQKLSDLVKEAEAR